ncbi:dynein light chain 2, cytoplasmic [Canna indica]|uniref:Dynein light chain 2, cytoplasmic n=1 Tax=Canna indica TaxID=4628 RepID=A0AAQ3KQX2_9LILI|nr:dynein light chain 2, cytoplasmic [Canna indica]
MIIRLFSKVLANRIKPLLDGLVCNSQHAFMSNRSSLDCYMGVHEIVWASHFLFNDDLIIFCKRSNECLQNLHLLLRCFEMSSGLHINVTKSTVTSLIGNLALAENAAGLHGCQASSFPLRYLGLPLSPGKMKKEDWMQLISCLDAKLCSWQGKLLSRAGRLVLVNSSISSTPSYLLSLYKALEDALRLAGKALDEFDVIDSTEITRFIEKEFDRSHGPGWQCIVGTDFGSFVTHLCGCFIYVSIRSLAILLFKGAADPEAEAGLLVAVEAVK